jgi:hypothetical protein
MEIFTTVFLQMYSTIITRVSPYCTTRLKRVGERCIGPAHSLHRFIDMHVCCISCCSYARHTPAHSAAGRPAPTCLHFWFHSTRASRPSVLCRTGKTAGLRFTAVDKSQAHLLSLCGYPCLCANGVPSHAAHFTVLTH